MYVGHHSVLLGREYHKFDISYIFKQVSGRICIMSDSTIPGLDLDGESLIQTEVMQRDSKVLSVLSFTQCVCTVALLGHACQTHY